VIHPYTAFIKFPCSQLRVYIYWRNISKYPAIKFHKTKVNSNIANIMNKNKGTASFDFVINLSIFISVSEYS